MNLSFYTLVFGAERLK